MKPSALMITSHLKSGYQVVYKTSQPRTMKSVTFTGRCPEGQSAVGMYCYTNCDAGLTPTGTMCWSACPAGYDDLGSYCVAR